MEAAYNHLNILTVEDNPGDLFLLEDMLRSTPLHIEHLYSAQRVNEARQLLLDHPINLILLDLSLPDTYGLDSFIGIRQVAEKIPVIILTGLSDTNLALEAIKNGAQDYLVKGEFNRNLLSKSIQYSLERKVAEENILASEARYKQMFYKNPYATWICDGEDFRILEVNDAAIEAYEYNREEFLKLKLSDLYAPDDFAILKEEFAGVERNEKKRTRLWRQRKKSGEQVIAEVTFYPVDYLGKKAIQQLMHDVTEERRLEKKLAQQQKLRARQITEAVLGAQERERSGIGRELHDNINQILATSKLYLDVVIEEQQPDNPLILKSRHNISIAIEEIRKISKVLITPVLDEVGLGQSVMELTRNILEVKKMKFLTDTEKLDESMLTGDQKLTLYRIVQEQLNNILKYAEATEVTIHIESKKDIITLIIEDNGKGFDTNSIRRGVGITNMMSRAELYNGKVEIDSAPGKGCRLKATLNKKPGYQEPEEEQ
jgi:two-component system sensor histidine kinase UhpB